MNSRLVLHSVKRFKINLVVKIMIVSDYTIWSSYQLLAPVFAIFVTDKVHGSIETVGIASAIFLISKSIFEIPIGLFIDKTKSEKNDFYTVFIGTALMSAAYLMYIFVTNVFHLYLVQFFLGFASALTYPGWRTIFSHHVDKGREAFEWSLYDVVIGLGMASTAALGGFIADRYGFDTLFLIVASCTFVGALTLFLIKDSIYQSNVKKLSFKKNNK